MSIDREIDARCDAFEKVWGTAEALTIEEMLPKIDQARRPRLLIELVKIDLDLLNPADLSDQRADYHARFPEYRQDIDRAFREVVTRALPDDTEKSKVVEPPLKPGDSVAKYELQKLLGMGSFGAVYLAEDPEIGRKVAIKVPLAGTSIGRAEADQFLRDAQHASKLKHPGIVTIFEVGRFGQMPYIVQEFLSGGDLKEDLQQKRYSFRDAATLVLEIAEALEAAHEQGIIHRDVKPGNILLTKDGRPCITDFGLAMRAQMRHLHVNEFAGAPAYMAPEQVRGESHRIDARTDIWGVGAIFYYVLCGVVPFVANNRTESGRLIKEEDPLPPQSHVAEIPAELERICLKCLSKRMSDRYPHASNLIDELRRWLNNGTQFKNSGTLRDLVTVRPKGLRPFDQDDEDYFLHLLPGPRDANGIPDSVRFWTTKISQLDAENTFPVGLLYGPSGSGKTSFVKAGVLPRLPNKVTVIYVESTADETELRILKQIRGLFPHLPPELDLPETIALLRDQQWISKEEKILIVLDQFEQWLHANRTIEDAQLVEGIRQCDGGRVQALIMVRDDFWMGITRFMEALEMDLVQRGNADIVDRFNLQHARKVLQLFGVAYGHPLPEPGEERKDYEEFLEAAALEISTDDRVVSIHVALFAEMLKNKPWRLNTLQSGGGAAAVGVAFLEEAFDSDRGNPSHRTHVGAARRVLELLLPEEGTQIKGHMRSLEELREASGHASDERSFNQLLAILDP